MKLTAKYLPTLAIMGIIFVLSTIPGSTMNSMGLGKEVFHVNGHFFFFLLLTLAFYRSTKDTISSVLFSIAYGVLIELIQIFVPARSVSSYDIYVDVLAALLAGAFLWKLLPILPEKLKNLLKA